MAGIFSFFSGEANLALQTRCSSAPVFSRWVPLRQESRRGRGNVGSPESYFVRWLSGYRRSAGQRHDHNREQHGR